MQIKQFKFLVSWQRLPHYRNFQHCAIKVVSIKKAIHLLILMILQRIPNTNQSKVNYLSNHKWAQIKWCNLLISVIRRYLMMNWSVAYKVMYHNPLSITKSPTITIISHLSKYSEIPKVTSLSHKCNNRTWFHKMSY